MEKGKLIDVKITRIEKMPLKYQLNHKGEKGLIAIETRMYRSISIKEVDEIVKLYLKDKELAYDKYEERIKETVKIIKDVQRRIFY